MLQQTQVATVIPYYNEWLRRFPDFAALAAASESDVLHAWQGLGYYCARPQSPRRRENRQDQHGGRFPGTLTQFGICPALAVTPRMPSPRSPSINPFRSSKRTSPACSRAVLQFQAPDRFQPWPRNVWHRASTLVPRTAPRLSTRRSWIWARLSAARGPNASLSRQEILPRGTTRKRSREKSARVPIKQLGRTTWLFRAKGSASCSSSPRIAGAACGCCRAWHQVHIDRAAARFGLSVHQSSHHPARLSPGASAKFATKSNRWFAYRRSAAIPIPSPHRRAIRDVALAENFAAAIEPRSLVFCPTSRPQLQQCEA